MAVLLGSLFGAALDPVIWIVGSLPGFFLKRYSTMVVGAMCAGFFTTTLSAVLYETTAYPGAAIGTDWLLAMMAAHQIIAHGVSHVIWAIRRQSRRERDQKN